MIIICMNEKESPDSIFQIETAQIINAYNFEDIKGVTEIIKEQLLWERAKNNAKKKTT